MLQVQQCVLVTMKGLTKSDVSELTTLHESDGRLVLCLCLPPPTSTFDGRRLALLLNYLLRFSNMIIWSYLAGQLKFVPAALQGTHSQGLPVRTCEVESVK
jgi:hypothetical protein